MTNATYTPRIFTESELTKISEDVFVIGEQRHVDDSPPYDQDENLYKTGPEAEEDHVAAALLLLGHLYPTLAPLGTNVSFSIQPRPQSVIIPDSTVTSKQSVYAVWMASAKGGTPHPLGLLPAQLLSLYRMQTAQGGSRSLYAVANAVENKSGVLTHSSYWNYKEGNEKKSVFEAPLVVDTQEGDADGNSALIVDKYPLTLPSLWEQNTTSDSPYESTTPILSSASTSLQCGTSASGTQQVLSEERWSTHGVRENEDLVLKDNSSAVLRVLLEDSDKNVLSSDRNAKMDVVCELASNDQVETAGDDVLRMSSCLVHEPMVVSASIPVAKQWKSQILSKNDPTDVTRENPDMEIPVSAELNDGDNLDDRSDASGLEYLNARDTKAMEVLYF